MQLRSAHSAKERLLPHHAREHAQDARSPGVRNCIKHGQDLFTELVSVALIVLFTHKRADRIFVRARNPDRVGGRERVERESAFEVIRDERSPGVPGRLDLVDHDDLAHDGRETLVEPERVPVLCARVSNDYLIENCLLELQAWFSRSLLRTSIVTMFCKVGSIRTSVLED